MNFTRKILDDIYQDYKMQALLSDKFTILLTVKPEDKTFMPFNAPPEYSNDKREHLLSLLAIHKCPPETEKY